jgi:hypothetical protein
MFQKLKNFIRFGRSSEKIAAKTTAFARIEERLAQLEKELKAQNALAAAQELAQAKSWKSFQRKRRLFFSDGYFSTLNSSTIIRQNDDDFDNFLLISIDKQNLQENIAFAQHCGFDKSKITTGSVQEVFGEFEKLKEHNIYWNEIFCPFPCELQKIKKTFYCEKLFCYEEGLETYGQLLQYNKEQIVLDDFVDAGFYLQPKLIPYHSHAKKLNLEIWKNTLHRMGSFYPIPEIPHGTKNILYCQSSLYQGTPEVDKKNLDVAEKLREKEFHIWCRPHPRYDNSLTTHLREKSKQPNGNVTFIERSIPLSDIFIAKNYKEITAVIGEHGTALINAKLFGIPAYRLNYVCNDPARFQHISDVIADIPPIENFLKTL